jgi:hypothetical protein
MKTWAWARAAVLERVAQRLLHDRIGRDIHVGGQIVDRALDAQFDRQSCGAYAVDEILDAARRQETWMGPVGGPA